MTTNGIDLDPPRTVELAVSEPGVTSAGGALARRLRLEWQSASPRQVAAARWLWRHPTALLVPALAALVESRTSIGDGLAFMKAGSAMWGDGFLHVFANSWLQIGPLYLLAVGAFYRLFGGLLSGNVIELVLALVESYAVLMLALGLAGRLARRTGRSELVARWGVGLVLVVGQVIAVAAAWGHPEEIVLGLAIVYCAVAMRDGASARVGAVLGLAFGLKQWAVIGAGAVLLGRRPRPVLLAGSSALVIGLAAYAPFALFGEFNTFQHVWHFDHGTLLGWIAARTGLAEWSIRAVQGLVAAAAGAVVAWRRPGAPLLVAMTAIGARVLLDPLQLPYYVSPFLAILALWLWTSRSSGPLWLQISVSVSVALLVVPFFSQAVYSTMADLLIVGTLTWALIAERGSRPGLAPLPTTA